MSAMTEKAQGKRPGEASAERSSRDLRRRQLLQGMASGGVLALVGLAGETPPACPESGGDASAADHTRVGFRTTDHVRWFYRRARL